MRKNKIKLLALAASTAFLLAPANANAQGFTDDQKKEIEAIFKQMIADNPQAILDSVEQHRVDQEKKSQQTAQENLKEYIEYFKSNDLPMAGNPEGDITLVEYFDYNCGYCRKAFADIQTILSEDKNVRVILQEMPILSPSSAKMAAYALAALKQGKYFEMHVALMEYKGSQTDTAYLNLGEKIGLDVEKLKADVESADVKAQIQKTLEMARNLGIRGTPGFIIGEKIFPGYIGVEGLRKGLKEARAAKASKAQ